MQIRHGAQIVIVGAEIAGRLSPRALDLRALELGGNCADDAGCDLVLQLEDVVEPSFKSLSPKMGASCSIHELSRDAHPALYLAHATFDDVPHTKLAADLLFVHRLAFVSKTRVASDHEQPADARQGGDDIFHDAVGKIILLASPLRFRNGNTAMEGESGR